ncbi:MAG: hypothetical protein GF383_10275 [Candidatus Lokiarchaeota archaeon]|nr:hypothetical protein [Candidatus Lokiarchaeota archaeon]MBD3340942.1 hypothetical protein [Candidatus Lokiarchaeota archaeon]
MKNTFGFFFSIVMVIAGFPLGVMTMLPNKASKPCLLGYYARCPFMSISSMILFALGIVGVFLVIRLIKNHKKE